MDEMFSKWQPTALSLFRFVTGQQNLESRIDLALSNGTVKVASIECL